MSCFAFGRASSRGFTRLVNPAGSDPKPATSRFRSSLFEQEWWRDRLSCLGELPPSVLLHCREDLSSPTVEVVEFRLRAPDGLRLVGLRARRRFGPSPEAACVRALRATEPLTYDQGVLEEGCMDIVVQLPLHHTLEQRVLDLILALRFAESDEASKQVPILVDPSTDDEVTIASRLYLSGLGTLPTRPAQLDDRSGLGTLPGG